MVRGMLVEGGVVVNVAVFESAATMWNGWVEVPAGVLVGPGFTDNGDGTFTAPVIV